MIPYIPPTFSLIGFEIPYFGVLVFLGVMIGIQVMRRQMSLAGFPIEETRVVLWLVLSCAFMVSHLVEIFLYNSYQIDKDGVLGLFMFWDGMSSTGGFLGATVAFVLLTRLLKDRWWTAADIALKSFLVAWVIARFGCTMAHDHMGRLTDFFLAFAYPGGARHNLGFYEFLLTLLILLPVSQLLERLRAPPGAQVGMACFLYSPVRFGLDFLRATDIPNADPRFAGLTFAQYMCVPIFFSGIWLLFRLRKQWE